MEHLTISATVKYDGVVHDLTDIILETLTHHRVLEVINNELEVELDQPSFDVIAVYSDDTSSGRCDAPP